MKKTLVAHLPDETPQELRRFAAGAALYDSSCSAGAKVWLIEKGRGYYLKSAGRGALEREAGLTKYFWAKGLGAEVLAYISGESDWLLTAAVPGEDGTHERYLSDPKRLCDVMARALRALHELDHHDCPVPDRTAEYLAAAEKNYRMGNYAPSRFPDRSGYRSADEAYALLRAEKAALQSRVLLHGDYCLPNMIFDNWKLSGFVDVGCGGVGDRHIDLFWGVWTLWFNLKTDRYRERFLDAYGRDKADESILKVIAAAEAFG